MKKWLFSGILLVGVNLYAQSQFTFVFLNNKPDKEVLSKEKTDSIMAGHMANIKRLAKEGKLQVAGPFGGGGGLFILNTTSLNEAKQWLETDPGVQANCWNIEMMPYTPRVGSACTVGENYQMTSYQFVRFNANATSESIKQHNDFLQKLNKDGIVIAEGTFDQKGNGILVLKGDTQKETIEADPAVKTGLVKFDMKKLYIAKGSFCEK